MCVVGRGGGGGCIAKPKGKRVPDGRTMKGVMLGHLVCIIDLQQTCNG